MHPNRPRCVRGPAVNVSFTAAVPGATAASLRCSILRERTARLKAPLASLAAVAALTRPLTLHGVCTYRRDAEVPRLLGRSPSELDRCPPRCHPTI